MSVELDYFARIRRAGSAMALYGRNLTGGKAIDFGTDIEAEITTENLKLLEGAIDNYDTLILEYARWKIENTVAANENDGIND